MPGFLPPVVATLLMDGKQFSAEVDKSEAKMEGLAATADSAGGKFSKFASKASTAIIGAGVAIAAYGIDKAVKFTEALDTVQNQTNVTDGTLKKISKSAIDLSNNTTSSATEIVGAYGAAEAAGLKWAKAHAVVTSSAKLAQISGNDVVTTTKALIAAQNIGITKGMSYAKVADLLTVGLKGNEQGLSGVVTLLQGKVGTAFAAYHQSAGEGVAIANEFSQAGVTQTRQIATFVNKLGTLNGPLETTSVSNGKLTTSTAGYVNALVDVGLNVDKTKTAFSGPDGLINGLKYLKTTADGSLPKLQQYLTAIFGASGVGTGMALINNLTTLTKTVHDANNASAGGLNKSFNISQGDISNQMKELKNQWENILQGVGMFLLPDVKDLAHWAEDATQYFENHPLLKKIASDASIGLFVAAIAYKLGSAVTKIIGGIGRTASKIPGVGGTSNTDYLKIIADNTTKIAGEAGISDTEGGAGDAELGAGALGSTIGKFGSSVLVFGAGVAAFEAATKILSTKEGKKVGNYIIDNNVLGLGTISNVTADLLHKRVHPSSTASPSEEKYLKSIGEWGNYTKMMVADEEANYTQVAKLSAAIQKAENKHSGTTKVTVKTRGILKRG